MGMNWQHQLRKLECHSSSHFVSEINRSFNKTFLTVGIVMDDKQLFSGMRNLIILCTLIGLPGLVCGQLLLTGKVMDSKSDLPLEGVTIFNKSQQVYKKAGFDGQYAINVRDKDTIIFSFTGYRADTVVISVDLLRNGLDIGLKALPPVLLDTVLVKESTYAEDSIQRRREYAAFYRQRIPDITGGNRPSSGFGISVSPLTYFSGKERAKRRLKKRLEYNEQQAYIDHYFSRAYVHRVTGLTGEQLQKFMLRYRPSYHFLRSKNNDDLVRYINDSLKEFKKSY
jgi:hypothetical protein